MDKETLIIIWVVMVYLMLLAISVINATTNKKHKQECKDKSDVIDKWINSSIFKETINKQEEEYSLNTLKKALEYSKDENKLLRENCDKEVKTIKEEASKEREQLKETVEDLKKELDHQINLSTNIDKYLANALDLKLKEQRYLDEFYSQKNSTNYSLDKRIVNINDGYQIRYKLYATKEKL